MKRFAFLAFPLLCFSGPALSADLDGPVYRERDTVIERPLPPRVVEKRIIEHHYYEPAPLYERRIYTASMWQCTISKSSCAADR